MKVLPFQIPKPTNDALIYQEDHEFVFYDKLHQHEEIQLSCIVEGSGTLVIGDTISQYQKGDILAIDGNLPHVFKSDVNTDKKSLMLTLFFTRDSFGKDFFYLEELSETRSFFRKIENGFQATSHKASLQQAFESLSNQSKLERFTTFLAILQLLSKAKKKALSSYVYKKQYSVDEGKRMRDVMSYTMEHFHEMISLERIAEVASMTKNAFCKYFKKRTNKTYVQFLNELRIEHACKLLRTQAELSISEIAFDSGFGNVSNFNRQFLVIKGMSPTRYKKLV
jgi:AraC-like DNA-binding protein